MSFSGLHLYDLGVVFSSWRSHCSIRFTFRSLFRHSTINWCCSHGLWVVICSRKGFVYTQDEICSYDSVGWTEVETCFEENWVFPPAPTAQQWRLKSKGTSYVFCLGRRLSPAVSTMENRTTLAALARSGQASDRFPLPA